MNHTLVMSRIARRPSSSGLASVTSWPIPASTFAVRSTACATSVSTGTSISGVVDHPIRSGGAFNRASAAYGSGGFGIGNGSPICGTARQSSIAAASRTVFVCTKFWPRPYPFSSINGPNETRPRDGFSPTPPQKLAGMRIDPAMSDPCAIGTMPAATAAMPPPVEPPAEYPRFQGVDVFPCSALSVVPDIEYSGAAERPRMLTPDARNSSPRCVSCSVIIPRHSRLPNSIARPASCPKTSLIRNGTPRNGPAPSFFSSRPSMRSA